MRSAIFPLPTIELVERLVTAERDCYVAWLLVETLCNHASLREVR